ncbi:MAG: L,D-transpeptidase [Alphaproteobacteria bacterium]|nr:MAG: L,D-transpeptidase [Alphaproteobacteria bacterium]
MLTRRHFVLTTTALFSAPKAVLGQEAADPSLHPAPDETLPEPAKRAPVSDRSKWDLWDAQVTPPNYDPFTSNPWGLAPRFLPHIVEANPGLEPGSIHVDAVARYLYHILDNGMAIRYGVAIARGNLYEPGTYRIGRKVKWPTWTPTANMIKRDPFYEKYKNGVDGGPLNPLGSRALYLYEGNRDTYLRIHGSPHPESIGGRASSGCVRMVMAHIIHLYPNVEIGTTAILYPAEEMLGAAS